MRALSVVVVDEPLERKSSLAGRGEDLDVQALGQDRPDPALRLAVGLGPIGAGPEVAQAEPAPGATEDPTPVRAAVVGQEALDRDAVGPEPAQRPDQEASGRAAFARSRMSSAR